MSPLKHVSYCLGHLRSLRRLVTVLVEGRYACNIVLSQSQRRHVLRWLRSRNRGYLLDTASPWIAFDAVDYLVRNLPKGIRVFEYGSGGSTLFWLKFDANCVSVEHDPCWYESLQQRLCDSPLVDYRLIQPTQQIALLDAADPANPQCYASDDPTFDGYEFRAYASQIDSFPEGYFDVVLIDGRARPSCIMHSSTKIKVGGLLILDNADRHYYTQQTQHYLRDFIRLRFRGVTPGLMHHTTTDIYVKGLG